MSKPKGTLIQLQDSEINSDGANRIQHDARCWWRELAWKVPNVVTLSRACFAGKITLQHSSLP